MSPTWKAAVGVILVFILGWIGGSVTTIVVARHEVVATVQGGPEALAIALERRTTRDLGLNEDQKTQLHAVLVSYARQRLEVQKSMQPQVRIINRQTLQQIDALLTPEQQQHFHDNLVLFKERFGRNPFSIGSEEKAAAQNPPPPTAMDVSTGTNTPPAVQ